MRLRAQLWRLAIAMALLGSVSAITAQPEQDVAAVRQAAEQGDAKAQAILGAMYEYGEGVTKDAKQAVAWYRQAARSWLAFQNWSAMNFPSRKRLISSSLAWAGFVSMKRPKSLPGHPREWM